MHKFFHYDSLSESLLNVNSMRIDMRYDYLTLDALKANFNLHLVYFEFNQFNRVGSLPHPQLKITQKMKVCESSLDL